jgi:hypothetical protein
LTAFRWACTEYSGTSADESRWKLDGSARRGVFHELNGCMLHACHSDVGQKLSRSRLLGTLQMPIVGAFSHVGPPVGRLILSTSRAGGDAPQLLTPCSNLARQGPIEVLCTRPLRSAFKARQCEVRGLTGISRRFPQAFRQQPLGRTDVCHQCAFSRRIRYLGWEPGTARPKR